jgi:hypothetical protein
MMYPRGSEMPEHITQMEITGSLNDEAGKPVELDMFVYDEEGNRYGLNVMTVRRYEEVRAKQQDLEVDPDAPNVFVLNEDNIVLDSLAELLRAPIIKVFDPYLLRVDQD